MKKALIICYYWPPAGGPGVQRWLKFVKYLRDFGIEPILYIPENPSYPMQDKSLEREVPAGTTILKYRIFEPYSLAKIFSKKDTETISSGIIDKEERQSTLQKMMLYIRGNFFIPDARIFWVKPSIKFLSAYLAHNPVDVIITTGPPHSLHLIGLGLKSNTNIPWMADFRDPWTSIGYHHKLRLTKRSQGKHKQLEKKVLQTANHIMVTSPSTKRDFERLTETPITCITNGFDDDDEPALRNTNFSIAHIGSLLADRNPILLWDVLSEVCQEDLAFAKALKIKLAGRVSESIVEEIRAYGLSDQLELLGYVGHTEALNLQRSSQILLLVEIDSKETQPIIPGKLFEYLAAKRPILAIGPQGADLFEIVKETQSGFCFEYSEKEKLKEHLLQWYQDFTGNGIQDNDTDVSMFSRRNLTKQLVAVIDQMT